MEGDLTRGDEHIIQCSNDMLWNYSPEPCIILLIHVIPKNSTKRRGRTCSKNWQFQWCNRIDFEGIIGLEYGCLLWESIKMHILEFEGFQGLAIELNFWGQCGEGHVNWEGPWRLNHAGGAISKYYRFFFFYIALNLMWMCLLIHMCVP